MKRRDFIKTATSVTLLNTVPMMAEGKEENRTKDTVSLMAVQLDGYDKMGDIASGLDPMEALMPHIEKAGANKTDLLVFPEYHLGRIRIPGPETERIGEAVRKQGIHIIVGSWELLENDKYANAALLFGRDGNIIGKCYKTHAAVDSMIRTRRPSPNPHRITIYNGLSKTIRNGKWNGVRTCRFLNWISEESAS